MAREIVSSQLGKGGSGIPDNMPRVLRELSGLTITSVVGAAAGTAMSLPGIRPEDTILAAVLPPAATGLATAEVQRITVDATGGTFTITYGNQTTPALAFNVTAAAMQTALENLSNINPGDVVVTGGPGSAGGGTPYVLTWSATLGNVAGVTTTPTLTGGATTAAVTTTTPGVGQAGGAVLDDAANITIQSNKASGTLTFAAAVDGNVFNVNDVVYTVKLVPTAATHLALNKPDNTARNNNEMAAAAAAMINSYEARYNGSKWTDPQVYATASGAVVTVTAVAEGAGNALTVTGTASTLVVAGSGTTSATLTSATVVANNTFAVNGVTFTAKAAPLLDTDFGVKADNTLQAAENARVINAYQQKYGTLAASATAAAAVTTITASGPKQGNLITLTGTPVTLAASGSGTLAGGTATGSIKSTTDLSGKSLLVFWYNKQ